MSGSWPAAAGGGSSSCEATTTATAATPAGRNRRSITSFSCVVSPRPAAIEPSASTKSTRSHTSKPCHAVISPVYQFRNRLTSRSRAPSVTSSGPASSLRVISPPSSASAHTSQHVRMRNRDGPPAAPGGGAAGVGPPQRAMVTLRVHGRAVLEGERDRDAQRPRALDPDRPADLPGGLQPDLDGLARDARDRRAAQAAVLQAQLAGRRLRRPQPGRRRAVRAAGRGEPSRRACGTPPATAPTPRSGPSCAAARGCGALPARPSGAVTTTVRVAVPLLLPGSVTVTFAV